MQSLWTRASQLACTCRCPSCLHQKASIVRRISSITGKVTSRPFSTGTLLYSSIFAAACTLDSAAKEQRKKKWDAAITKAKQDIESIEQANTERLNSILASHDATAAEAFGEDLTPIRLTTEEVATWTPGILDKRPHFPISTAESPHPEQLPPQSLWSGPQRRLKAAQSLFSEKKLRLTELGVTRLVLEMFLAVDIDSRSRAELETLPASVRPYASLSRADQRQALSAVKAEVGEYVALLNSWDRGEARPLPVPTPYYKQLENDRHELIDQRLVTSFKDLFEHLNLGRISIEAMIINISNLLLTSPAPLAIQPYNVLLIGFLQHSKSAARFPVLEALIGLSGRVGLRPNEFTCAAILRAYRVLEDRRMFAKFVALMRAQDDSLMLARPDVKITDQSEGRLVRKGRKVLQAVLPSTIVYRELILGLLKFMGFDTAIQIIRKLNTERWGLDWDCLHLLMMDCVVRRAWDDGMIVLEQMELLRRKARSLPAKIHAMILALCKACDRFEEFEKKFQYALDCGHSRERILNLITRVFVDVERNADRKVSGVQFARDSPEEEEQPSVEATEEHNALPTNHQRAVEHDGTVPNQMATDLSPRRLKSVSLSAPLKVSDEFEQDPKFTRVRITMVAK